MKPLTIGLLAVLLLIPFAGQVSAEEGDSDSWSPLDLVSPGGRDLIPRPTITGAYIWTDLVYFRGWRIQISAVTGEHRLIDPHGLRHAWGTYVQCRDELSRVKKAKNLAPMEGRAVLVLHGLLRSPSAMEGICGYIRRKSDFTVINVGYPSTLKDIGTHARYLAHLIDNLEGIEEIDFVAHSMGNIVLRHYLTDRTDPKTGRQGDPRIKRSVMLAPPNNGSVAASMLAKNDFFVTLFGSAGRELGTDWKDLLRVWPFEFRIRHYRRREGGWARL